MFFNG